MELQHRIPRRTGLFVAGLVVGLGVGFAVASQPVRATATNVAASPLAWVPPPGVVQISPCVPTMGEHWANPDDLPMGPIYTVDQGQLISIEYMPGQDDFAAGRSWNDLTFRYNGQPLAIEHADVDFQPHGHEGYEVPHYDMHFYLVSHAEDRAITCQPQG